MRIPFTLDAWLKDKSQKVETRDGRIIHNIWRVKEPTYINNRKAEVCALIDGEEDALVFFEGGRYLPTKRDIDNPFDLFIVTPEPELTVFEKAVKDLCWRVGTGEAVYKDDILKKTAAELLAIATEELKKTFVLLHKDDYQTAFDLGKAEALKDLPRWKKTTGKERFNKRVIVLVGDNDLLCTDYVEEGEYYLPFSDLGKLPKEDGHE